MTGAEKTNELPALLSPLSREEAESRVSHAGEKLLGWYSGQARDLPWRRTRDPYKIWLSEIMLQQTRVETVIPYYERFLKALPDIPSLAAADEETLHKLWEGLGYYSRVRNLRKAARQVMERYGGMLPGSSDLLLDLCGIGDYTAGAVASIAFGEAVPAVDGNALRVFSRILAAEGDIMAPGVRKEYRTLLRAAMPQQMPGNFNQAVMDLGATVCLPGEHADCERCPVRAECEAWERGQTAYFPVRAPRKERKVEERTVFLLCDAEGKTILHRRPSGGLLGGLWEFPSADGKLSRQEAGEFLQRRGIRPGKLLALREAKHIFTHIEWRMAGFLAYCGEILPGENEILASSEERHETYAVPSAFAAFQKVLDQFGKDGK